MKKLIKRVAVVGCRDYDDYDEAKKFIDACLLDLKRENEIIIVSGCARGADSLGERYAEENGYKAEKYPAQWQLFGKSAGPKRNKQMAEVSDLVICFWDEKSRGTKSMIDFARKFGKDVMIKKIAR